MKKLCFIVSSILLTVIAPVIVSAHPMPSSVLLLDVHEKEVTGEVQIPLSELGLALNLDLLSNSSSVTAGRSGQIKAYLKSHIKPQSEEKDWLVTIGNLALSDAKQTASGRYQELIAQFTLTPPQNGSTRNFTLNYDAVIHQVVTHTALVSVRQDWANGVIEDKPVSIGTIKIDSGSGQVKPLQVDVSGGSTFKGFVSMLQLGMSHIREGTDHLLFLLTLLLPAPLLIASRRWQGYKGFKKTLMSITKITAAFTIGHSLTLVIASLTRVSLPSQPIEALIAFSIIVSAVHAIRPIFPKREIIIAGFFGLIHGMAFSFTLAKLNLSIGQLALSLFGFNLGIELMQLFIILLVVTPLVIVAMSKAYAYVRVVAAAVAIVAATGWLVDRIGLQNIVSDKATNLAVYAPWLIAALYALAAGVWIRQRQLDTK